MILNESALFLDLLQCTREGDLEKVSSLVENFSVELNCVDKYDYSPLILASLCGHISIVRYLLEHGALLERDTFDGARCLYGALNDEIRNLLLKYDASTSIDLMQPFAAHLTALRRDNLPLSTSDITFSSGTCSYKAHRFLLGARSPYIQEQLMSNDKWRARDTVHLPLTDLHFELVLKYIYVDNLDAELSADELRDLTVVTRKLKIPALSNFYFESSTSNKRERQQQQSRIAQEDLERFVKQEVIGRSWIIKQPFSKSEEEARRQLRENRTVVADSLLAIPVSETETRIYPVHRSMLIKSEYYLTAFTSGFAETYEDIPFFTLDISREVAEIVLMFLYVDRVDIPRSLALEVLETASFLLLSKERSLKSLAAISITNDDDDLPPGADVSTVLRVAWQTETQRVEQYAAKFIARHLDEYLFRDDFRELVEESANRISNRQETDTIELVDDIRFYLSQAYGIYLEMNPIDERKPGESVKEDLWVPLTTYEHQYNEQLAKLDNLLDSLSLDA